MTKAKQSGAGAMAQEEADPHARVEVGVIAAQKVDQANYMLEGVHHINFLVTDLESAIERYQYLFDLDSVQIESLIDAGLAIAA